MDRNRGRQKQPVGPAGRTVHTARIGSSGGTMNVGRCPQLCPYGSQWASKGTIGTAEPISKSSTLAGAPRPKDVEGSFGA